MDQVKGINIENGSFSFGERLLYQSVNIEITPGKLTALIGLNGAGKSTLFDILVGQMKLNTGDLTIQGKSISNWSQKELASKVGLVLTSFDIDAELNVGEVLEAGRMPFTGFLGRLSADDKKKIEEIATELNLSQLLDSKFESCSDGEKQRVLIASALVKESEILLLDEPTAFMDLNNKVGFYGLLQEKKESKTILFSTHDIQMALEVGDEFLVIHDQTIKLLNKESFKSTGILNELFDNQLASFNQDGKLEFK